jgi:hypothetical protein
MNRAMMQRISRTLRLGLIAATMLATPSTAWAQAQGFCTIFLLSEGTLQQSIDLQSLSSKLAGGQNARAFLISSNSRYEVSIHPPVGFSLSPPGAPASVLFDASMSGQGATVFAETPDDTPVRLRRGFTRIDADLVAAAMTGTFATGDYRATATLRCE